MTSGGGVDSCDASYQLFTVSDDAPESAAFSLQANGQYLSVSDVATRFQQIPWVPKTLPVLLMSHAIDSLALVDVTEEDWDEFFFVHDGTMQKKLCRLVQCCALKSHT